MKIIIAGLAAVAAFVATVDVASAQVPARFRPDGQAVCPSGYAYRNGACFIPRGYGGYDDGFRRSYGYQRHYGGGRVVRPRWDPTGSAVCPSNFDYVAGACRSRY